MDTTIRKITVMMGIFFSMIAQAQNSSELFNVANNAYEQGHIQQALEHYCAIPNKGPAVWYNMGNCHYHLQDLAQAIICWQRSMLGCSYRDYFDANAHCTMAQRALNIECSSDTPLETFFNAIATTTPVWLVQLLLLMFWIFLWLMIMYRSRMWYFNFLIIGILLSVLFWGLVVYMQWRNENYQYGVVVTKNMTICAGPHHEYHTIGSVPYGDRVTIIERRPDWYKIAKDDKFGWVVASAIELVKNR